MNKIWRVIFCAATFYSFLITGCGEDITIPPASTRVVVLYSPVNDTTLPASAMTFKWGTTAENADSFKFQLARDSAFTAGVQSYGTANPEYTVNPLTADSNYTYWRVTAFWKNHNDSLLSAVRKFRQY